MRVRTSVRMASSLSHIAFPVASAALHAERLEWLLEHQGQISMDRGFELAVCELISRKDPQHLLPGSAEFAERVAVLSEQQGVAR
jgi:hypothetical protein